MNPLTTTTFAQETKAASPAHKVAAGPQAQLNYAAIDKFTRAPVTPIMRQFTSVALDEFLKGNVQPLINLDNNARKNPGNAAGLSQAMSDIWKPALNALDPSLFRELSEANRILDPAKKEARLTEISDRAIFFTEKRRRRRNCYHSSYKRTWQRPARSRCYFAFNPCQTVYGTAHINCS